MATPFKYHINKFPTQDMLIVFSHHTFSSQLHKFLENKKCTKDIAHTRQYEVHRYLSFERFKKKDDSRVKID